MSANTSEITILLSLVQITINYGWWINLTLAILNRLNISTTKYNSLNKIGKEQSNSVPPSSIIQTPPTKIETPTNLETHTPINLSCLWRDQPATRLRVVSRADGRQSDAGVWNFLQNGARKTLVTAVLAPPSSPPRCGDFVRIDGGGSTLGKYSSPNKVH